MYLKKEKGFSIAEVIIAMMIVGGAAAWGVRWLTKNANEGAGRATADYQSGFQQVASQFFGNNRVDIEAAMGGDAAKAALFCRINVATDGTGGTQTYDSSKRTCAFDTTLLRAYKVWPSYMDVNISPTSRYVAVVKQTMSSDAVPVATGQVEMLIVNAVVASGNVMTSGTATFAGDKTRAMQQINSAMDALGGQGGFVPPGADTGQCNYNATVKQACGKNWKVNLADFL